MSKDVIVIGAGGHAKVIADIILCSGDKLVGFLDDDESKQGDVAYKDYKVIGKISDADKYSECYFVIGVGDNHTRAKIAERCARLKWYTAVHPNAVISDSTKIGEGTVIMAGVVINSDTVVGKHCILNTSCTIDHDNRLGGFVHISPGAHLAGTVSVGDYSWICIGAVVSNNVDIVDNVVVGANSTVLKDVSAPGIYVGSPAKLSSSVL